MATAHTVEVLDASLRGRSAETLVKRSIAGSRAS
jgi:hypothetical protein